MDGMDKKLASVARMLKTASVCNGLGLWAAGTCGLAAFLVAADILFRFGRPVLGAGLLLFLSAAGTGFYLLVLRRAVRPVSPERAARYLEERFRIGSNILINWVQLRGAPSFFTRVLSREAGSVLAGISPARAVPRAEIARSFRAAALAAALCAVGLMLFPERVAASVKRYVFFTQWIEPVTRVKLAVSPGDCTVRAGGSVEITAVEKGEPVERVFLIVFREGSPPERKRMAYVNGRFSSLLADVRTPLTYRVEGGDFLSRPYTVTPVEPPRVVSVTVRVEYPPCLRWRPFTLQPEPSRKLTLPPGSEVYIAGECSVPVASVSFLAGGKPAAEVFLVGETAFRNIRPLRVERDLSLGIVCRTAAGVEGDPFPLAFLLMPLKKPAVRILKPGKNLVLSRPAALSLLMEGKDLYGIDRVELLLWTDSSRKDTRLVRKAEGERNLLVTYLLDTSSAGLRPGGRLFYQARIYSRFDKLGPGESAVYSLRLLGPRDVEKRKAVLEKDVRGRLEEIVSLQKNALQHTRKASYYARVRRKAQAEEYVFYLARDQRGVRDKTEGLLALVSRVTAMRNLSRRLRELWSGDMEAAVSAVELVTRLQAAGEEGKAREGLAAVAKIQKRILAALNALLERKQTWSDAEAPQPAARKEEPEEDVDAMKIEGILAHAHEKLREFIKEEREVIDLTASLAGKEVDDLTEEEREILEKLRVSQEKWSEYFRATADEIAKLQPQDFSDSTLADEFVEAYSEVEKAAAELMKGNVEMAVPYEQAGVEKAEELTANLEKWLPDHRDNKKWVMEEPPEEYEVPMAELPEELDDLIGELVDDLEEMSEETEDVTSGWMDSLDQGAGWGVSDGPISNMSAKGKTGNLLPNSQEVGGRSGEGRTGRSSGQMVEKTASGKGGRETPTRVTPDPYEAGSVKDSSREQGGATGGGKKAGAGAEGLRGTPPPPVKEKLDRLAGRQAELISRAERLRRGIKKLGYGTTHLDAVIEDMKRVYARMNDYAYQDYARMLKVLRDRMKAYGDYVDAVHRVRHETYAGPRRGRGGPVPVPETDNLPPGYEDLVKGYFRKLLE